MQSVRINNVASLAINPDNGMYSLFVNPSNNSDPVIKIDLTRDQIGTLSDHILSIFQEEFYQVNPGEVSL